MYFYGKNSLNKLDISKVNEVLNTGYLSQGKFLDEIEKKVALYVGAKYCLAVSSGTAALHLAIMSFNLKPHQQAITSPMTFVATTNACIYSNIKYKLIDIDKKNLNISNYEISNHFANKANSTNTRLIIPVHFGGFSCDMKEIHKYAKKNNCFILEDASQAMGGNYLNKKIGSCQYSDISVFSLHPVKTITSGEGGLITTNNFQLYKKMKLMRSHGIIKGGGIPWKAEMITIGYNYRITELQCAMAISQLQKIDKFIDKRKKISDFYKKNLINENVSFQKNESNDLSANHLFILIFKNKISFKKKLLLYNDLKKNKIIFAVQYLPIHKHKFYKNKIKEKFNNAEKLYNQSINLPIYPDLQKKDLLYIVSTIKKIFKKHNI